MDKNLEKKPTVTILLPVHNDEKWLAMCLESIKMQTFGDFKCIVGFNGTVDRSKEIFMEVCSNDQRFQTLDFGGIAGKSRTLNSMLEFVESQYTCLVDGDDIWIENKLERQIQEIQDFDVIGTLAHYINEKNEITYSLKLDLDNGSIVSGFCRGHNQIVNSSCMVKTESLRSVGGWDSSVEGMEDFDVWIKIYLTNKKFKNIPEYLVLHRIHKESNFNAKKLPVTIQDILKKNRLC